MNIYCISLSPFALLVPLACGTEPLDTNQHSHLWEAGTLVRLDTTTIAPPPLQDLEIANLMLEVQALHGDELAAVDTTAAAAAAAVSTGGESSSSAVKEAAADEGDDDGMSEIRIGRVIFNGVGEDAHVDPFLDVVDNYVEEVSARGGLDPGEGLGGEAGGDGSGRIGFWISGEDIAGGGWGRAWTVEGRMMVDPGCSWGTELGAGLMIPLMPLLSGQV